MKGTKNRNRGKRNRQITRKEKGWERKKTGNINKKKKLSIRKENKKRKYKKGKKRDSIRKQTV